MWYSSLLKRISMLLIQAGFYTGLTSRSAKLCCLPAKMLVSQHSLKLNNQGRHTGKVGIPAHQLPKPYKSWWAAMLAIERAVRPEEKQRGDNRRITEESWLQIPTQGLLNSQHYLQQMLNKTNNSERSLKEKTLQN